MDPLTAALNLANTIAELWRMHLESLPEEQRRELAKQAHEDLQAWRKFFERFKWPDLTPGKDA